MTLTKIIEMIMCSKMQEVRHVIVYDVAAYSEAEPYIGSSNRGFLNVHVSTIIYSV